MHCHRNSVIPGGDQPVLGVVAVCERAVVSEIAVAVVGRADRSDRGVLVQIIGGIADAGRGGRIVPPAVVGRGLVDASQRRNYFVLLYGLWSAFRRLLEYRNRSSRRTNQ